MGRYWGRSARHRCYASMVAALLMVVTAGCSQIPTSGPVIGGNPVDPPEEQRPFIRVEAPPPQVGDSPVGIVDGFIEAMGSYAPGYETARLFLTEDARLSWDADAGITVYQGARPIIEAVRDDTVRVKMTVVATVGEDASYVPAEPGTTIEFHLTTVQENGEWRIADPPPGIVIAEFSFGREYEPRNVYFFDPGFEVLVPDLVYLPTNEKVTTLLAQELLGGPSDWLAPAVRTAFPDGTELGVNAVPVDSGIATVELSEAAGLADPEQRELMAAQLVWTLAALPGVDEVLVTSAGIPLTQGEALSPDTSSMAKYDPAGLSADAAVYAVGDAGLTVLTGGNAAPVGGPLGTMPGISDAAVDPTGAAAAVVSPDGAQLSVAAFSTGEPIRPLLTGTGLRSPAWDRTGLIWVVDRGTQGSKLVAVREDGKPVRVVAPELAGRAVERLAVALDGCRVALIVDGRLYVGVVTREVDDEAAEVRVDRLRRYGPDGEAIDVGWSASDSLAVLVDGADQEPMPYVVGLSGQVVTSRATAAEGATALAAAPGRPIIVQGVDGVLLEQRPGNRWNELVAGKNPTYPG